MIPQSDRFGGCEGRHQAAIVQRHDWQKMIAEVRTLYQTLYGKRLTDYKLGMFMECGHETVAILAERGEPRHTSGELLRAKRDELFNQLRQSGRTTALSTE